MKKILYAVAGLALLASCSTEEVVEVIDNRAAITFSEAYVENATRAIDGSYTMNNLGTFNVYGTLTTNEGQGDVVNIFPGVPVNKNGSEWTYTHATQYWIEGNDYMFRAIAGEGIEVRDIVGTTTGMANTITVANIANVNDILLAEEEVKFREGMTPETVEFTFSHLLSKVKFTVRVKETASDYTYKVSDIAIDNTNVAGTYKIETKTWGDTTTDPLEFGDAVAVGTIDPNATAIKIGSNGAAESLYERQVIPATYTDMAIRFQLEVLHGNTVVSTKEIVHKVSGNTVLQAGNAYNFVLEFGAPGDDIEFTVNGINPWVDNTVVGTVSALQAAINAANGETITLTGDIALEQTLTIPAGKDITLDLAGKTISGDWAKADGAVIKNNGTLTIKGGTVSSTGINGGSAIVNNGTLTVEDMTLNGAPIQDGGWPSYGVNNYGTLTINGADITTYHGAVATGGEGVTVINDATIDVGNSTETNQTSWALYVYENGQLTVNDGTFSNTKNEYGQVYGGGYICTSSTKETIINGGTFDKSEADNNGTGFYYNNQNLVIKGGTFDADPSAYVANGYKAVNNNGTWTIEMTKVGEILKQIEEGATTIALTEDLTVGANEQLIIPADKTVTLDLNGKTIEGTISSELKGVIKNEGTLTIKGGTVSSTATNGGSAIYNYGTLTVEDATLNGAPNGTSGNASYALNSTGENSKLILNNATINGRGAIGATNGTKVEVNGGTYHTPEMAWGHAVYASGAGTEVVINGGTFTEGYDYSSNGWGMYQIYAGDGSKVIVNDGDFSQEWDCANGYDLATAGTGAIEIKGGVFADNPSSQNGKNYVANGYKAVENSNGTWTIERTKVGEILKQIEEGAATIALTEDLTFEGGETFIIPAGKTVTLDLNGKEVVSASADAFVAQAGATLTISGNGTVKSNGAPIRAIGGKVTVEGGTFTQTGAWNTTTSTYRYCVDSREGGEVIIKGGTFNTNNGLISVSANSSLVIDGGEFTFDNNTGGTRHFAYVSGALTINDGVFRGVADSGAGGCFFCGAASTCNIQVNGGKFTSLWTSGSVNRIFESYASGSSINVTGGLFNTNGGIASFVEDNTDAATMAEYPYKAK